MFSLVTRKTGCVQLPGPTPGRGADGVVERLIGLQLGGSGTVAT